MAKRSKKKQIKRAGGSNEVRQQIKIIDEANRRLEELEKAGLQSSPAYSATMKKLGGETRFNLEGLSGKYKEQMIEMAKHFTELRTSTVKGTVSAKGESEYMSGMFEGLNWIQQQLLNDVYSHIKELIKEGDPIADILGYWNVFERVREIIGGNDYIDTKNKKVVKNFIPRIAYTNKRKGKSSETYEESFNRKEANKERIAAMKNQGWYKDLLDKIESKLTVEKNKMKDELYRSFMETEDYFNDNPFNW